MDRESGRMVVYIMAMDGVIFMHDDFVFYDTSGNSCQFRASPEDRPA